jgi:hypothetical protein
MELPYWTHEDCFIFKPEFNNNISCYTHIIINYKKLIFSNKNNSEFDNGYFIRSKFNQLLTNSLDNLTSLTYITFGYHFNQSLTNSLDNLTNLTQITFGYYFNQPLTNSLDNLTNLKEITFGKS